MTSSASTNYASAILGDPAHLRAREFRQIALQVLAGGGKPVVLTATEEDHLGTDGREGS